MEMSRIDRQLTEKAFRAGAKLSYGAKTEFIPAFDWLPGEKRKAIQTIYAFKRLMDDISYVPGYNAKSFDQAAVERPGGVDNFEDMGGFQADDFGPGPDPGFQDEGYVRPLVVDPELIARFNLVDRWRDALTGCFGDPYAPGNSKEKLLQLPELMDRFSGMKGVELLPGIRFIVDLFNIPKPVFMEMLYGAEMDIVPQRFANFDLCADYCHAVGTSMHVASLAICGTNEPLFSGPVVKATKAAGVAFRWTEILNRLLSDVDYGRLYLPLDELTRSGLTENQFFELIHTKDKTSKPQADAKLDRYAAAENARMMAEFQSKYERLITTQMNRCETYFFVASELYRKIDKDSRKVYGLLWSKYYSLYRKLCNHPSLILKGGTRLSMLKLMRLTLRWGFLPKRALHSG